jgi:hypothetical protein
LIGPALTQEWFMTIDERLDRLTERHEALTQSVELLLRTTEAHSSQIARSGELIAKNATHIAALVRIAESHENRIDGLEGQQ